MPRFDQQYPRWIDSVATNDAFSAQYWVAPLRRREPPARRGRRSHESILDEDLGRGGGRVFSWRRRLSAQTVGGTVFGRVSRRVGPAALGGDGRGAQPRHGP